MIPVPAFLWKYLAAAGAIAALSGGWWLDHRLQAARIYRAEAARDAAKAALVRCQIGRADLEASLSSQKAAVARLEAAGRARQAGADEAAVAQRQALAKARAEAARFVARPPEGATACARSEHVAAMIREDMK